MQLNACVAFIIAAAQLRAGSASLTRTSLGSRLRLSSLNTEVKPGSQNAPWRLGPKVALLQQSGWPPKAAEYAWWATTYGDLAPTEVCDMCGGWPGHTKWIEISPTCAKWVITLLKCSQVCNNSNRFKGYGNCLSKCGVEKPKCDVCTSEPAGVAANISDYCSDTCKRWNTCKCTTGPKDKPFPGSDKWMGCISDCAFNCKPALQLELDLGFSVSWRDRKCPPLFFGCAGDKHKSCTRMESCPGPFDKDCVEKTCAPPLGTGSVKCYHDDPYCGGRPAFPDTANETTGGHADFCEFARKEGELCREAGFIPMWKKAQGAPVCEEGLVCDEKTHKCSAPPPPEPEVDEAAMGPGPGPGPAPAPAPAKPTEPPHPQWEDVKAKMKVLREGGAPAAAAANAAASQDKEYMFGPPT